MLGFAGWRCLPLHPTNACSVGGEIMEIYSDACCQVIISISEVQKKWGILDMKRLKAERSREGALHSLSSAARRGLIETRRFFSSCLRTLQAQLWGYWDFWCPYQYRLEWQALRFCKTHSNPEAALQPSSKGPQQSWEAQQHNWTCSQVTAIFPPCLYEHWHNLHFLLALSSCIHYKLCLSHGISCGIWRENL